MSREKLKNDIYMDIAISMSKLSYANRMKVGAVIVDSKSRLVGEGYNGTPSGVDNVCETDNNVTKDYVIHAEVNAILNAHKSNLNDCKIYVTLAPCLKCSGMIIQKGIKTVYYKDDYRDMSGVEFLKNNGVNVIKLCSYV